MAISQYRLTAPWYPRFCCISWQSLYIVLQITCFRIGRDKAGLLHLRGNLLFRTATTTSLASAISLHGEMCFANGPSPSRNELRVMIAAPWTVGDEVDNALSTSAVFSGVPSTIIKPFRGSRDMILRTRAIKLWPRERVSLTTSSPVRPLAPMCRKRILIDGR